MTSPKKNKKTSKDPIPRRGAITKLWLLLGGLALGEGAWVVSDIFAPGKRAWQENEDSRLVVAGPVDRFEPGTVTPFQQGKFYLARLNDGGFLALSRACTHLGCTVPWVKEESRFPCPCHASSFNIKGEVLSPPAPRPLDLFAVRIENQVVKVDVSKRIERKMFSKEQVAR